MQALIHTAAHNNALGKQDALVFVHIDQGQCAAILTIDHSDDLIGNECIAPLRKVQAIE